MCKDPEIVDAFPNINLSSKNASTKLKKVFNYVTDYHCMMISKHTSINCLENKYSEEIKDMKDKLSLDSPLYKELSNPKNLDKIIKEFLFDQIRQRHRKWELKHKDDEVTPTQNKQIVINVMGGLCEFDDQYKLFMFINKHYGAKVCPIRSVSNLPHSLFFNASL